MSYIGSSATPLPVNFSAVQSQGFNGTGSQTTFTLNRSVGSAASIEVLVNNVQQSPYDGSYNITGGTSLVFSEAPSAGTNNVYVVYRDQALGSLTDTGAVRKAGDTMTGELVVPKIGVGVSGSSYQIHNRVFGNAEIATQYGTGNIAVLGAYADGAGFGVAGTVAVKADASGRVTMPYQPGFRSGSSTFDGSSGIASAFATSSGNTGGQSFTYRNSGNFNTTTGVFTAPIAGKYLICATYTSNDGTNNRNIGWLYINGGNIGEWVESYGPFDNSTGVTVETLQVGDTVQFARHPGIPYEGVVANIDFLG